MRLKFKEIILKYKEVVIGFAVIFFVVVINRFPDGYTILGGDVFQYINIKDHFLFYWYEWFNRVTLFYGVFYLLEIVGVGATSQLSWYLGIFLLGSYFSFWFFSRLIFPAFSKTICALLSVFYATNIYTLFIFTQVWGFTPYMMAYIFIPILTGLYIAILKSHQYHKYLFIFLLLSFLLSVSFINPAFAVVLGIYFSILTVLLLLARVVFFNRDTCKKIFFVVLGAIFMNIYWILPLLPQVTGGIEEVNSSEVLNLNERLQKTSNTFYDTFRLLPTSEQKLYFPINFPYKKLIWMKDGLIILSFLPFFILLAGFFVPKNQVREKQFYAVFMGIFAVFVILVARVRYPFDWLNSFLFNLPGLNVLRGYDKLSIVVPFLIATLLLIVFSVIWNKVYGKILAGLFFVLLVALTLPFYLGGMQTKMSYILRNQNSYKSATYSALIKIPQEYYEVKSIIDNNPDNVKVSVLPFSPGSSIGRIDLTDWKVNAVHFAPSLYNKKYIELNDTYIPDWMFAKDFMNDTYESNWITDLYGLIGIKYVIYHKDAKPKVVKGFEQKRKLMEDSGALVKLSENNKFILYEIPDENVFPYIYSVEKGISLEKKMEGLHEAIVIEKKAIQKVEYEKENFKKVSIRLNEDIEDRLIVINERYEPLWKAVYVSKNGNKRILKRDNTIKYANAWKTGKNLKSGGRIEVYHSSEPLMIPGIIITGLALSTILSLGAISLRKKYVKNVS